MIVARAQSDLDLWATPPSNLWHTRYETFLNEVSAKMTTISLVFNKHLTIFCFFKKLISFSFNSAGKETIAKVPVATIKLGYNHGRSG